MASNTLNFVGTKYFLVAKGPIMDGVVVKLGGSIKCGCFGEDGVGCGVCLVLQSPVNVLFSVDANRS